MRKQIDVLKALRRVRYVLRNEYSSSIEDGIKFSQDIIKLTKLSARISVIRFEQTHSDTIYVYCRTNHSKVFNCCKELGFEEI